MFKRKEQYNFAFPLVQGGEAHVETLCDKDARQLMELMLTNMDGFRSLWLEAEGNLGKLTVEHGQAMERLHELDEALADTRDLYDNVRKESARYVVDNIELRRQLDIACGTKAILERGMNLMQLAEQRRMQRAELSSPANGAVARDAGCAVPGEQPCDTYRVTGKNAVELAKILDRIDAVSYGASGAPKAPGRNELYIQFHEAAKKFGVPYSAFDFVRQGAEFEFEERCDPCAVPC